MSKQIVKNNREITLGGYLPSSSDFPPAHIEDEIKKLERNIEKLGQFKVERQQKHQVNTRNNYDSKSEALPAHNPTRESPPLTSGLVASRLATFSSQIDKKSLRSNAPKQLSSDSQPKSLSISQNFAKVGVAKKTNAHMTQTSPRRTVANISVVSPSPASEHKNANQADAYVDLTEALPSPKKEVSSETVSETHQVTATSLSANTDAIEKSVKIANVAETSLKKSDVIEQKESIPVAVADVTIDDSNSEEDNETFSHSDTEIYEEENPTTSDLYWNTQFQRIMTMNDRVVKYERLRHLAHDFVYAAQTYGKIIISERYLPDNKKTIKPMSFGGIAGGEKYKVQGILFKFAVDTNLRTKGYVSFDYWMYGGLRRSDHYAAKAAGHELKGLISFYNSNVEGLNFPLMALIDYLGFRVVALTIVPVDSTTLRYGSADAGQTVHADLSELNAKMEAVGHALNLKKHRSGEVEIVGPSDIEGHLGTDGRYYVLDFARVFPPEAPLRPLKKGDRSIYYRMLRPELVKRYEFKGPLNSDAFSNFCTHDKERSCQEVTEATLYLFEKVIPEFAKKLSTRSVYQLMQRESTTVTFDLTEEMHREGINVRHLGRVRALIASSGIRRVLLIEMIARIAKNTLRRLLRRKMRKVRIPSEDPYRRVVLKYLNTLLHREQRSDYYWKRILKRQIQSKFVHAFDPVRVETLATSTAPSPADLSGSTMILSAADEDSLNNELDPDYDLKHNWSNDDYMHLILRLQAMTGIELTPRALDELYAHPHSIKLLDIDLLQIGAVVKHMNVVEEAEAKSLYFQFLRATGAQADRLWELLNKKFTAAVASATNSVNTIFHWASALYQQGRKSTDARAEEFLKNSSEKYKACCDLQPNYHEAWFQWGHVLIELGKRKSSYQERLAYFSDAAEKYKHAINLEAKYVDTLWTMCHETSTLIQKMASTREKELPINELERLFLAGLQLYKILLHYRRSQQIYMELGNFLMDWANIKLPSEAEEYYIRAATMYEIALSFAPAVSDRHYLYVLRKGVDVSQSLNTSQFPILSPALEDTHTTLSKNKKQNDKTSNSKSALQEVSSLPSNETEARNNSPNNTKGTDKTRAKNFRKHHKTLSWSEFTTNIEALGSHSLDSSRDEVRSDAEAESFIYGTLRPSSSTATLVDTNEFVEVYALLSSNSDTKITKTNTEVSQSTTVTSDLSTTASPVPTSCHQHNNTVSSLPLTATLTARYKLPPRKLDARLWFELISTSSTHHSLDRCRAIFLDDDSMLAVKEDKVLNLLCVYEGSRFALTRVQIKFPQAIYAGRLRNEVPHGRVMIFVLDSLPDLKQYEVFDNKNRQAWKTFRRKQLQKKGKVLAEGNEPVAWFETQALWDNSQELQHISQSKRSDTTMNNANVNSSSSKNTDLERPTTCVLKHILDKPKSGKYLLIKLVRVSSTQDESEGTDIDKELRDNSIRSPKSPVQFQGFCVQFIGLKGYQVKDTPHPSVRASETTHREITSMSESQGEALPIPKESIEPLTDPQALVQTHLPLFHNILESQGAKFASLLRLLKCSPLLEALFVVFTWHRMQQTAMSSTPSEDRFVSLYRYIEHTAFNDVVVYFPLYNNSRLRIPAIGSLDNIGPEFASPSNIPSSSSTASSVTSNKLNLGCLRTVKFVNCSPQVNVSILKRLKYYMVTRSVTSLDLSGSTHLTDGGVLALTLLPNLSQLSLQFCPKITDHAIAVLLEKKPTLRSLFLTGCEQLTNNVVLSISRLGVSLEVLALSNVLSEPEGGREREYKRSNKKDSRHKPSAEKSLQVAVSLTDKYIAQLRRCSKLHSIALNNIPVSDSSIAKLIKHLPLRSLSLDGCQLNGTNVELTDVTIHNLARYASDLRAISLRDCQFSEHALTELIRNCVYLQALILDGSTHGPKQPLIAQLSENYTPLATLSMRHRGNIPTEHIVDLTSFARAQRELARACDEGRENELRQNVLRTVTRLRESEQSLKRSGRKNTFNLTLFRRKVDRRGTISEAQSQVHGRNNKEIHNDNKAIQENEKSSDKILKQATNEGDSKELVEQRRPPNDKLLLNESKKEKENENSMAFKETPLQTNKDEKPSEANTFYPKGTPTTIQILDFYRCTKLTNKSLAELALNCADSLRILDLSYCPQLSDSSVALLANCRLLEDLRLEGCMAITSQSLSPVVESCKYLNRLNASGCLIRDKTVILLAEKHPDLHTLLASACTELTDASLIALGRYCPKLYALNIRCNPFVTDVGLLNLAEKCQELHYLNVAKCKNVSVLSDLQKLLPMCFFDLC